MGKKKNPKVNTQDITAAPGCSEAAHSAPSVKEDYEYLQTRHASYCRQRETCGSAGLEVSGRYDQWIVTLPGGALALSLAFLEKIAPVPNPLSKVWLILAWTTLILALTAGFSAIFFSQKAIERAIDILDEDFQRFKKKTTGTPLSNRYLFIIHWLNWTSLLSFVVGLVSLCTFAFKNLPTEASLRPKPVSSPNVVTNKT